MKTITCPECNHLIDTTKRKKELQAMPATKADIHKLVTSIYDVQHMRLIFESRFTATHDNRYAIYADRLLKIERGMKDDAEEQTKLYPIHEWIIAQKGLSFDLAGQLIGLIQDIKRFDNVSKLWAYFGLAVVDYCTECGRQWYDTTQKAVKIANIKRRQKEQEEKKVVKSSERDVTPAESMVCNCEHPQLIKRTQKQIKGVLGDFNPTAKMLAHKVGTQFVKQGEFYRKLFEQFKAEYENRDDLKAEINSKKGKLTKGKGGVAVETKGTAHINQMAMRKMEKIFLEHLWLQWRTLDGLSVTKPYPISILGHSDYIASPNALKAKV